MIDRDDYGEDYSRNIGSTDYHDSCFLNLQKSITTAYLSGFSNYPIPKITMQRFSTNRESSIGLYKYLAFFLPLLLTVNFICVIYNLVTVSIDRKRSWKRSQSDTVKRGYSGQISTFSFWTNLNDKNVRIDRSEGYVHILMLV